MEIIPNETLRFFVLPVDCPKGLIAIDSLRTAFEIDKIYKKETLSKKPKGCIGDSLIHIINILHNTNDAVDVLTTAATRPSYLNYMQKLPEDVWKLYENIYVMESMMTEISWKFLMEKAEQYSLNITIL